MTAKKTWFPVGETTLSTLTLGLKEEWLEMKYFYFMFCFWNECLIIFFAKAMKTKLFLRPDSE